ncbi:precorrin-6y C5,15-methyltransferase (decarboxylating) subunit CbiE [Paenibacillus sp. SYP-B3998]|uniref:Precorrin-6y C5,15-methyltransferase (Decarboxylating) subunit CbiE n=1 Tax=Paenibacillus sp. SYP-B3998 TaxID=2678564 RepID=A0A6G3ZWV0_9BACL|nr:precorrin-6y C5,15-methyltransferase (decarboxylating) subunit CbiE [Paenibacillus sp. SYP-B3998]NEW06184.1 precorrin-6y C5,15-methyltransferase (decarboxylating) subunit CbiE [Paenibacillus sp. SYP-B3998]
MSKPIKMIGIGDNGQGSLLPQYVKWIEESEVLVGGERSLAFFPDYRGQKLVIKGSLSELMDQLKSEERSLVILASGDPLFYGMGGYVSKKLESVSFYPHTSSVQLAFARMGESWQDAYVTSVHGRTMKGLAQRMDGKDKIALLTDETNTPSVIAAYLLAFGMTEYAVFVAENLEGEEERCGWYTLEQLLSSTFSPLNVVILKKQFAGPTWSIGIEDDQFAQRKPDKGLITKKEVRVLSLSQMGLQPDSVVWDIGTCTGSVAIEAARIARDGSVFAIEKNEDDLKNCLENSIKFRVDITAVQGRAPKGLEAFPDPNAIFIGGSGGEMQELLELCSTRLQPGGRIVLNAATIETLYEADQTFTKLGFDVTVTLVQVSRSKPILHMKRFDALNPIYIITAKHKQADAEEVNNGE